MLRRAIVIAALAASALPALADPIITQVRVGSSFDTEALGINAAGDVTGFYDDQISGYHSFARTADGTLQTFDATDRGHSNRAFSINDRREIVGLWYPGSEGHGYLRHPNGGIKKIEAPGMSATYVSAINNKGTIAGNAFGDAWYGYTRNRGGEYAFFQMPEGLERFYVYAINDKGTIAGTYSDAQDRFRFFIRTKAGKVTKFKMDGRRLTAEVTGINAAGAVVGNIDTAGDDRAAFMRWPDGRIEFLKIDPRGPTTVTGINASGAITGGFSDGSVAHGFLRTPDGTVTAFDYPDAFATLPLAINDSNVITGKMHLGGSWMGFIRTP